MGEPSRLDKARRAVAEAEVRLRTHEVGMNALLLDAQSVRRAIEVLLSNEEFLREPGLVVSVQEYRKIRRDIGDLLERKDRVVQELNVCGARIEAARRSLEACRGIAEVERAREDRKVVSLFGGKDGG